jgi:serine/threonine protein kinase
MKQPRWIGQTLSGRYKLEELLGQGGMSAVYKATDPNLRRVVAIKMVHPHLSSDPSCMRRFEEEAAAIASLHHPNIVQVFDFNTDEDVNYMVMEYVPGETLQARLKRLNKNERKMSISEALQISINVCEGLSYAHKRGMVHRDVKPANIMLDVNGQAILMDLGIVKIIDGSSHTVTGAVMGTARYMPPEVVRSEPRVSSSATYNPPSGPNRTPSASDSHNTIYDSQPHRTASGPHPVMQSQSGSHQIPLPQPKKSKRWIWIAGIAGVGFLFFISVLVVGGMLLSRLGDRQTVSVTETEGVPQVMETENAAIRPPA